MHGAGARFQARVTSPCDPSQSTPPLPMNTMSQPDAVAPLRRSAGSCTGGGDFAGRDARCCGRGLDGRGTRAMGDAGDLSLRRGDRRGIDDQGTSNRSQSRWLPQALPGGTRGAGRAGAERRREYASLHRKPVRAGDGPVQSHGGSAAARRPPGERRPVCARRQPRRHGMAGARCGPVLEWRSVAGQSPRRRRARAARHVRRRLRQLLGGAFRRHHRAADAAQ